MKASVADIQAKLIAMGRPVIAEMFPAAYLNTIETTVKLDENGESIFGKMTLEFFQTL